MIVLISDLLDDPEQLREWLQNIKPEDFEKYNKA